MTVKSEEASDSSMDSMAFLMGLTKDMIHADVDAVGAQGYKSMTGPPAEARWRCHGREGRGSEGQAREDQAREDQGQSQVGSKESHLPPGCPGAASHQERRQEGGS